MRGVERGTVGLTRPGMDEPSSSSASVEGLALSCLGQGASPHPHTDKPTVSRSSGGHGGKEQVSRESKKLLTSELKPTETSLFCRLPFDIVLGLQKCHSSPGTTRGGLESAQLAPGDSTRPGVSGTLCSPKPAASSVQGSFLPLPASGGPDHACSEDCQEGGGRTWDEPGVVVTDTLSLVLGGGGGEKPLHTAVQADNCGQTRGPTSC